MRVVADAYGNGGARSTKVKFEETMNRKQKVMRIARLIN